MNQPTPSIYCPHCGTPVAIQTGPLGMRLQMAIALQASRIGTEIQCHQCRQGFIYTRLDLVETATTQTSSSEDNRRVG